MKEHEYQIEVDDTRLNILELKPNPPRDGAPLIFLHDAIGSVAQWEEFPYEIALRTGRRTIIYDRQGHGLSDPMVRPRGVDYLHREATAVLPALLQQLNIAAPILIGHSDGASIALIFAAHFTPAAVITEAAHILVEPVTLRAIREAQQNREKILEKLRFYHSDKADSLFDAWTDTWLSEQFAGWDIRPLLSKVECPVLVIQGVEDQFATEEQVWTTVSHIGPLSQALLLAGCGHTPHREAPEKIINRMTKFISDQAALD